VISDSHPSIGKRLKQRFEVNLPDVGNRILFLPRLPRVDYLHLVGNADVILDTLHYGGGANSLYDAFACGIPVVSFPGRFHRSRYAAGAYAKLGFSDLIATSLDDYVEKALRVGGDSELRDSISKRILERSDVLFFDDGAVAQHRAFFLDAIYKARQ
jgi:predicted O-linked N-acetylglucosamine transferase (SPINDLY family)